MENNIFNENKDSILGVLLSILSAVLFTLAFPPYGFWPLIFIGLVPMIVAQYHFMPSKISGLANGIAIGGFFLGYFSDMFAQAPLYMKLLPIFIGIIAGLISNRDKQFHEKTKYKWFVLHGSIIWVGIEMIRGFIPTIGTWGFVGYALFKQTWFLQPVSVLGIYGLNLLIILINYVIALIFIKYLKAPESSAIISRKVLKVNLVGVFIFLIVWIVLAISLYHDDRHTKSIQVSAIQHGGNVNSDESLIELYSKVSLAIKQGAQLVVLHEGVLPFDPQASQTKKIISLNEGTGAYVVIGYVVDSNKGFRNEATLLSPNGEFLGVYGKDHPVVWSRERSITRGSYPAFKTSLGNIGMIICYDLDFTDTARKVVKNGAEILAVPSNDWSAIAEKHYSHIVFRAIENGVPIIKADEAYDSVIVDLKGRIVSKTVTNKAISKILSSNVKISNRTTINNQLGDFLGWGSVLGLVIFAIYQTVLFSNYDNDKLSKS